MLRFLKLQNYAKFFTEQNIPKKIHPLRPIYARKSREKPLLSTREVAMAGIFVGRRPCCAAKILTMPSRASTHAPPPHRRDARHDEGTSDEGQGQKSDTLCPDRRTHRGRQARVITPRAIYDEGRGEQRSGQRRSPKKHNALTHNALPHQLKTAIAAPHASCAPLRDAQRVCGCTACGHFVGWRDQKRAQEVRAEARQHKHYVILSPSPSSHCAAQHPVFGTNLRRREKLSAQMVHKKSSHARGMATFD